MATHGTDADVADALQRFEDRTVLVTGAGSDIGRATAIRLAAEGASLYLTDLEEKGLKETAERCVQHGADVATRILDVSQEAAVNSAVAACMDTYGRLDCLCNAAGVVILEQFEKTTVEQLRFMVDINLLGTFLTTRAAMPYLIEAGGNIVNISSTSALAGVGFAAAYGATKGGVSALTRGIAVEFGSRGVRCNTIVPGRVATTPSAAAGSQTGIDLSTLGRNGSMPGAATSATIAGVIAMVASADGAHMNGSEIRVDGGWLS